MFNSRTARVLLALAFLYLFLVSIGLMGSAFKCFGIGFAKQLLAMTSNPIVSLFIGILATAIIQSSSTTTSLIVAMVSSGTLTVPCAVPMIMGANIGTTVTNTIVSMVQINRREEFARAFPAAIVHDLFNIMAVVVFLPLELTTRFLSRSAMALSDFLVGGADVSFHSPVKAAIKPVISWIAGVVGDCIASPFMVGGALLVIAFALLFFSLWGLVRQMRELVMQRAQIVFNQVLDRAPLLGIAVGAVFTAVIQSSSITTSILVPLAGAGIVSLYAVFPMTLGANIGTTITAILASTAGTKEGLTIALVHCLFNLAGVLVVFPFRRIRAIPVIVSEKFSAHVCRNRSRAVVYTILAFFVVPFVVIMTTFLK